MNRDFKGIWIPKEIWLRKDLSIMEKMFLVEIDSLDNEDGCYASNKYFSEFFEITKGRCTQIIKELEKKEIITIELLREGKQVVKRLIRVVNILNNPSEKIKQGCLENAEANNTSTNNTILNNTKKSEINYNDFLIYFNEICKGLPKVNKITDKRKSAIKARIKEYSLEEIATVFQMTAKSKFLNGNNNNNWKASFDWILNPSNFIKIYEGNYKNATNEENRSNNTKEGVSMSDLEQILKHQLEGEGKPL